MEVLTELLAFWQAQAGKLGHQTLQHIGLTAASLLLAVLVGVPLGLLLTRRPRLAPAVLGFTGVLQTIPSIALLGFLIPVLGIGPQPAIFALFLYSLLPIVRNTLTGVQGVSPAVVEAARGLGLTDGQVLRRVELPLALPVLFAGIRTATVINVGVATLAAYIAAGGLGEFIFGGIALNNPAMILAGAIPAAALALGFDAALARLQRLSARRLTRVGASYWCCCRCSRACTCCPAPRASCWPASVRSSWGGPMGCRVCKPSMGYVRCPA
ncbi:ABC transporter permease [Hymenobacter radiodurans]|uniref:ABC transporter permease n=1 Tax=Hymenobacter radiodurans TaxID=2496028 RepID=UPI0029394D1D|nr:ABC transporter permease [Hymenobacter radiodurans]